MSWYETGFDGVNKEEERLASLSGPFRLWLPAGKSNEVVLVDDVPACIYEHQWKMNGHWRNWFTCLQGTGEENIVCCKEGGEKSRSYVGYITIVQCTESKDKKGNKYQFDLQLLGAKLKILKKLRRKKEERGSLAFCRYNITREDSNSPSCGDDFQLVDEVKDHDKLFGVANYKGKKLVELYDKAEANPIDMAKLMRTFDVQFTDDTKTKLVRRVPHFNYMEIFKPKTAEEMSRLFKTTRIEEADSTTPGTAGSADNTVPF
jgi:hypothetical protein